MSGQFLTLTVQGEGYLSEYIVILVRFIYHISFPLMYIILIFLNVGSNFLTSADREQFSAHFPYFVSKE
jgi:hypothetical protein